MNILEALDDPNLFAPHFTGESWNGWKGFLAALFALPAPDGTAEAYGACTGRATPPGAPFTEAALIVGRRGGKSRILALVAVYLAVFRDYVPHLAAGELATIAVLAANRSQARSIFRFVSGLLKGVPLFARMILDENTEAITLSNRVVIEIGTASFRTTRGYSFAAVLCDEIAFWRQDETSANPDVEILRALRPGMASIPGSVLLMASSPYAKRGELYAAFRRHYGKDDARVLVWKADTATMNPKIDPAIIAEAYESDPESARAEYGAEFRDDLADFVSREVVDGVTMIGRRELPPVDGIQYAAFADPSGGVSDSFALAIGHLGDGAICVLNSLTEIRAPFDPEQAVAECVGVLNRYGITRVTSDKYAGLWPAARFAENGIGLEQCARPKSDIYLDFLALINSGRVELLDVPRLAAQLCGLERRTARSGRDTVDHGPDCKDDAANVVCGVLVGLDLDRRPALVKQASVLSGGLPLPLPANCKFVFAVLCIGKMGDAAVVYCATTYSGPELLVLDCDAMPLHGRLFQDTEDRLADLHDQCRAHGRAIFVPESLARHAWAAGIPVHPIPADLVPEELLLSATHHSDRGAIRWCQPAMEKAQSAPFRGALDFRAGENANDPLRQASILSISLGLDLQQ